MGAVLVYLVVLYEYTLSHDCVAWVIISLGCFSDIGPELSAVTRAMIDFGSAEFAGLLRVGTRKKSSSSIEGWAWISSQVRRPALGNFRVRV